MSSYSEGNDFNSILNRLLANVDESLDKREGSIIYDALAPAAAELTQCYAALDIFFNQSYLLTALGENLDNRVADYGLQRMQATPSKVTIKTYDSNGTLMSVPADSRFAIPNENGGYNFKIIDTQSTGIYTAECETLGEVGNYYTGTVLPLQSINNLGSASITSIDKEGEDIESDDKLRTRALSKVNQEEFAGNKAAYKDMVIKEDGAEECKVYPVWDGGGTVKLVVIAPGHTIPSSTFIDYLQDKIDPIASSGEGIGLAPIGHSVTVVAPTQKLISIAATLELVPGATIPQIQDAVDEQLNAYIYQVQNNFADKDSLIIYLSKVSAAILNVPQVVNVRSVTINGSAADNETDNTDPTGTIYYPMKTQPATLTLYSE